MQPYILVCFIPGTLETMENWHLNGTKRIKDKKVVKQLLVCCLSIPVHELGQFNSIPLDLIPMSIYSKNAIQLSLEQHYLLTFSFIQYSIDRSEPSSSLTIRFSISNCGSCCSLFSVFACRTKWPRWFIYVHITISENGQRMKTGLMQWLCLAFVCGNKWIRRVKPK